MKLEPYEHNPLLRPDLTHPWECLTVFNAGIARHHDLVYMLYRAQGIDRISRIGCAISSDGYHWYRLDKPVFEPGTEFETYGVEDPRITRIGDTFYMCYTGYSKHGTRACIARSSNLLDWERIGVALPDENNKDHALFPAKIGGKYVLFHRRPPDIWLCTSDDLLHWSDHQVVMRPRPGLWDGDKIGIAGPPIRTEKGWLLVYHGVEPRQDPFPVGTYRLGIALLDLEDPTRVLKRQEEPILQPNAPWEWRGDVPNVVFSCGQLVLNGKFHVYYGGADTVMAVASVALAEVEAFVGGKIFPEGSA